MIRHLLAGASLIALAWDPILPNVASQPEYSSPFLPNGTAEISYTDTRGERVSIEARASADRTLLSSFVTSWMPNRDWPGWGAANTPLSLLTFLEVSIGGKHAHMRMSAYADLANPRTLSVEGTDAGFNILLKGGSDSTLYYARLEFERVYVPEVQRESVFLQRRKVWLAVFPEHVWEETVYSWPIW